MTSFWNIFWVPGREIYRSASQTRWRLFHLTTFLSLSLFLYLLTSSFCFFLSFSISSFFFSISVWVSFFLSFFQLLFVNCLGLNLPFLFDLLLILTFRFLSFYFSVFLSVCESHSLFFQVPLYLPKCSPMFYEWVKTLFLCFLLISIFSLSRCWTFSHS